MPYLRTKAAGEYMAGTQPQTMRVWRIQGRGPKYAKIGNRILYDTRDLDEFLESRKFSSTAEAREAERRNQKATPPAVVQANRRVVVAKAKG